MADRDVEIIRSKAVFVATLRRVANAIERAGRTSAHPSRCEARECPEGAKLSIEHEVEGDDEALERPVSLEEWRRQQRQEKRRRPSENLRRSPGRKAP
jgi:hypothetical protein